MQSCRPQQKRAASLKKHKTPNQPQIVPTVYQQFQI